MPAQFFNGSMSTTDGSDVYPLAVGDTLYVGRSGSLVATGGGASGLRLLGDNDVTVDGQIYSQFYRGIVQNSDGAAVNVQIGEAGTVRGGDCGAQLGGVAGGNSLVNHGEISSVAGSAGEGVFMASGGNTLTNYGLIESDKGTAILFDADSGTTNTIVNYGLVTGATALACHSATDLVTNKGTLVGAVSLGDANDLYDGRLGHVDGKVSGDAGADTLYGGTDDDTLDGGSGADRLAGGAGDDTYFVDVGGASGDQIVEAVGGGQDTVAARVSYTLATGVEVETLRTSSNAGTTAISLAGNAFANKIYGNAGANTLNGREGADTMTGFGGADAFVFDRALGSSNIDHIADFAHGVDKIRLDHTIFTALPVGALAAAAFKDITSTAEDANDRILYNHTTGALFYDADGAGGAAARQFATLDDHPATITAADFVVIA